MSSFWWHLGLDLGWELVDTRNWLRPTLTKQVRFRGLCRFPVGVVFLIPVSVLDYSDQCDIIPLLWRIPCFLDEAEILLVFFQQWYLRFHEIIWKVCKLPMYPGHLVYFYKIQIPRPHSRSTRLKHLEIRLQESAFLTKSFSRASLVVQWLRLYTSQC